MARTRTKTRVTLSNKIDQRRARRELALPGPRSVKASPFLWPDYRASRPEWHVVDFQSYVEEGYNLNTLIYSTIMYKVRSLGQVPLRAYRGDVDHPEALESAHPLAKLCARPNPHQSFIEFQGQNAVYLNLSGNCYVFLDRPRRGGLPEAMYSLRPDRVFVLPDKGRQGSGLLGYLYVPEGRSQWGKWSMRERRNALQEGKALPIPPENLMHVKLPNPGDPLEGMGYGLSPLSPAARSADVDNKVTEFLKLFFDHGTQFTGLLSYDIPLDPAVVPRIKEQWAERYGGYTNWADIAVLDQGGSYQRISASFDEMGFEQIDSRNESRILGPFGVPPILIGTRFGLAHATYSNYEEARQACWEDTLVPESKLYEVEYRYYLAGEGGEFVAYDYSDVPALRQDTPALIESWVQLVTNGVPKDVATEVTGLGIPPLEDGKIIYMPLNLMPVGGFGEGQPVQTEQGAASAEEEDRTKALLELVKKKRPRVGG